MPKFIVIAALILDLSTVFSPARAEDNGPVYVVSYVEFGASAISAAKSLLKELRDAGRKEMDNGGFDILQSIYRPQHFVVLERWKSAKAQESHAAAAATKSVRDKLRPLLTAPYDERVHNGFALGPEKDYGARALYVVTHVDFMGAKKDPGLAAIRQLATESVKDAGVLRYDVLQQTSHTNHLTLVEIWRSRRALEVHEQTDHARKFREELLPIGGSPYDEQLYRALK